jgi:hypothetical protein
MQTFLRTFGCTWTWRSGGEVAGWAVRFDGTKLGRVDSPSNDNGLSFATNIKPLFRQHDQQSMERAFDLWSFDDVRAHASDILERVKNGSMPCDGAWPPEQVQVFQRWVDSGMAP